MQEPAYWFINKDEKNTFNFDFNVYLNFRVNFSY